MESRKRYVEPPRSDKQALCQSDTIAAPALLRQRPCPLSLAPLASSPSRGASGETVHFAGTAKASPTRGGGTASAVTERLYEGRGFGRPEGAKDPLSEIAAPRGAGYFAKFRFFSDSSFEIEHRKLCEVGLSCEVGTSQMTRTSQTLRSSNIIRIYIKYSEHRKMFHHSRTA